MQLQKAPLGLLGAFALKVMGRNPTQFADAVSPVIDVYDQYLATSELQVRQDNTNINATALTTKGFSVPAGKAWRLLAAGGQVSLNAADVALILEGQVGVNSPLNSGSTGFAPLFVQTTPQLGTGSRMFGLYFPRPLFLPSGWQIGIGYAFSAAITVIVPQLSSILIQEIDL